MIQATKYKPRLLRFWITPAIISLFFWIAISIMPSEGSFLENVRFYWFLPLVMTSGFLTLQFWQTKYRRDPYRFAGNACRFFQLPQSPSVGDLEINLEKIGFVKTGTEVENGSSILLFKRERMYPESRVYKKLGKKDLLHHHGIRILLDGNKVLIEFVVYSRFVNYDGLNAWYETLEEVIDVLDWHRYRTNWDWVPIDENWKVRGMN